MDKDTIKKIEAMFRKEVKKSSKVQNAYLLIHSDKSNIHMNIAEGTTGNVTANPQQSHYIASIGKLFTSTIIAILYEKNKISFDDYISKYLDDELLDGLHIYKEKEYTNQIKIKHLLNQTSGLYDSFWPLLDKILEGKQISYSPRETIIWAKNNLKTNDVPGKKVKYTDTNYHLLGLIIENITGKPFHKVLEEFIFIPLGMENSSMNHYSEPQQPYKYPIAKFSIKGITLNNNKDFANIDYSGGGVISTNEDLLRFIKSLANGEIISKDTLRKMKNDSNKLFMGVDYGYGIWKLKSFPLLLPEEYTGWGCVGATGAFMFYFPKLDVYSIGNFNDVSYMTKGIRFMMNIIKKFGRKK